MGSLLAATASYLDARSQGIAWRVRLDDLDGPRNEPGAERAILQALERHALCWDGPVTRQSEGRERYAGALAALEDQGLLFRCRCSRRELAGHAIYPGTCRRRAGRQSDCAIRVRVDDTEVEFTDLLLGAQHCYLARDYGDFVVHRRDGVPAYQLATAVDDGSPEIARVIRGRDLLHSTPLQVFLMRRLGLPEPRYGHARLLLNADGQKLSKQNGAAPLDPARARDNLAAVLTWLGLVPDSDDTTCEALLAAAVRRFTLTGLAGGDLVADAAS